MTITAPVTVETQSNGITIADIDLRDEVEIIADAPVASELEQSLIPFLLLGVLSWFTILAVAILLAF